MGIYLPKFDKFEESIEIIGRFWLTVALLGNLTDFK
jgi:hypothetical protein